MGLTVTEQRITRAIRSKIPSAVSYDIRALIYRERKPRWIGPYRVHRVEDKPTFITDGQHRRPFYVSQLLPYTADRRDLELKRRLKGLTHLQSCWDVCITKVFNPGDAQAKTKECRKAISK